MWTTRWTDDGASTKGGKRHLLVTLLSARQRSLSYNSPYNWTSRFCSVGTFSSDLHTPPSVRFPSVPEYFRIARNARSHNDFSIMENETVNGVGGKRRGDNDLRDLRSQKLVLRLTKRVESGCSYFDYDWILKLLTRSVRLPKNRVFHDTAGFRTIAHS